ncbi:hypothetical protein GCM10012290_05580 [Halolactibacillus alkaliphilus]|uniref:Phosphate ABC transporter ATPase n=1 Tax=Halolactibacillus alkaliphilus TaxID=442899 RepID=A0A511X024_9BACI|nr:hypothetical protein [Halolactibacillus alkaliphilus]GEN56288.1 hypothetical protein HAL01_07520 [Halolactibacillus alkaliphilus]GGN66194.1 hypothetical protein GCM10012290_05580 [Halolactibacillus alkaliphilus]SFO67289.1 hypothetical protein SAMN05720591_10419 [Halolactibacillus alkaliphilus]
MILNIDKHDFSIIWDGVYYKALSDYPHINDWELKSIIDFVAYEKSHGRETEVVGPDSVLINKIKVALEGGNKYLNVRKPDFISECTSCQHKGCLTDYLCHVATKENAIKIIQCGSLLSARKVRNEPANLLMTEKRNAAKDPIDFFDYIMFSWGNCQAGDRLVMERTLGRMPTENDLSNGFKPGVRFYFKYDQLALHSGCTSDGYHALKIKDEVILEDYVDTIVIPNNYREEFSSIIPAALKDNVFYLNNDCNNIWEWSAKVYECVKKAKI